MTDFIRWTNEQAAAIQDRGARAFLMERGLPGSTIVFELSDDLGHQFIDLGGRQGVRLGTFDEDLGFYLDCDEGEVCFGAADGAAFAHVNKTLQSFVESILLVENEYPFYRQGDAPEVAAEVGRRLRMDLAAIDESATDGLGSFWRSFVHDVSIGDYYEGSV
jgi:hypothetical protein